MEHIHRKYGAQAVRYLWSTGQIQAKFGLSRPADPLEQAADKRAEEMLSQPHREQKESLSPTPASTKEPDPPGKSDTARKKESSVQSASSSSPVNPVAERAIHRITGESGSPLPASERRFFESRLGSDLSEVRLHTNGDAAGAAASIHARAFTLGEDIVFGKGEYRPGTADGRKLLAHELAHVEQQREGEKGKRGPESEIIHRYTSPLDILDYIGLTYDVGENIYLTYFYEGDDREFQLALNALFTTLDIVLAALPGIGGGGVAARLSHGTLAYAWGALPASAQAKVVTEVAKEMSWSIAKAGQFINAMMRAGRGREERNARGGGPKGPKGDRKQVNDVAREFKMDGEQRKEFGNYIERLKKEGHGGSLNERGDFTYEELREIAKELLGI